ncbi:MAG: HEAT repeat domain-containing protein [Gemmatimonadota bacterium]
MAQGLVSVLMVGTLVFGCGVSDTPPNRAERRAQRVDSATQLPVDHWGSLLTSGSPSEQKEALGHLGFYEDAAVPYIKAIVRLLEGNDQDLGSTAAWSLAHIGPPAYPALVEALDHRRSAVRRRAAYGVGEAGPEAAGSALNRLTLLSRNDPVQEVRVMATWAIGEITRRAMVGDPNLGMTDGLDSDSLDVRLEAIERLGAIGSSNRAAISVLIRLLADTQDVIQGATIDALAQKGRAALPALRVALDSPKERVRSGAVAAMARIDRPF